jgi:HAD superfamily hydrolase (TIGR01549 family)
LGTVKVVLTDFERTLVRLFEDGVVEQKFFEEVWSHYVDRGLPKSLREAAGESPYSLWTKAHRWLTKHQGPLYAEGMYHAVSKIATKYEIDAAESVKLFDDVKPVLERLKTAGIPVMIVSNNATRAVKQIVNNNNAQDLVADVIGREYIYEMVGNLKPKPNLLVEALKRSKCHRDPGSALLIGDSVDDMKAGRKARIRLRVGLLDHSTATRWQLRRAGARLVLHRFGDLLPLVPGGDADGNR